MSGCHNVNVSRNCPPGIACPTPMALPSYTAVRSQPIPMPIQQSVTLPQQQFGIVGGPSYFAPPPAVSYAPHYVCYNMGHQSYNNTLGTLANIIIGAIYSTPMSGGNTPGQLATTGAMMPYANYVPPGQNPEDCYNSQAQYQQGGGYAPTGYKPQPAACATGSCGDKHVESKSCDPCAPRGPMAYDALFNGSLPHKTEGADGKETKVKEKSCQWDANVSGGKGTIKISDRYEIKLNESNSEWVLYDKCEKKTTTIWGDPHLDTQANGKLMFKETMTFVLEDGTKITAKTEPFKHDPNQTGTTALYITNGDKSMKITGLGQSDNINDGDLSVVTSLTNGKAVDKMIDDGAITLYQVGDLWVNAETSKEITQAQIDNAEACYDDSKREENAYKGSNKCDDELAGTDGGDTYIATDGEDLFRGGKGNDAAIFSGDIEDYEITKKNGYILVTDGDGNETKLYDVENLEFNGKKFSIASFDDGRQGNLGGGNNTREIVFGLGGNDEFILDEDAKTKYFDGGDGNDTLTLSGTKDNYEFDKGEGDTVIIKDEDTGKVLAVVSNIEQIKFSIGEAVALSTLV